MVRVFKTNRKYYLFFCFLLFPNLSISGFPKNISRQLPETVNPDEIQWKQKTQTTWHDLMEARKQKYSPEVESKNAATIRKIDTKIKALEARLDQFANEGASKNYRVELSEEVPLPQITFPPLPKNEKVLGAVSDESDDLFEKNEKPPMPLKDTDGVYKGHAVIAVSPFYPLTAKIAKAEGDVVVELTISKTGKVIFARCVKGHPLLQKAALSAASQWRFQPTILVEKQKKQPVNVVGVLTFRFSN